MMKTLFTLVLTTLSLYSFSQGCTISTSNLTEISGDDGSGNCIYSIDILFIEGSGPDNGTLTFSSGSVTILSGAGPHSCACSGNTYTLTFEATCGGIASFSASHDNSGNGNDCSVSATGISLPVKWLDFDLEIEGENKVGIYWSTAIEINNDYFEIEYSEDGEKYNYLATIEGAGTTYNQSEYSYTHRHDFESIVYYRIKQVDFDDNFSYSEVKYLNLQKEKVFNISPNPAQEILYISGNDKDATFQILDLLGQSKFKTTKTQIDLSHLTSGLYTLLIESDGTIQSHQFVISK